VGGKRLKPGKYTLRVLAENVEASRLPDQEAQEAEARR